MNTLNVCPAAILNLAERRFEIGLNRPKGKPFSGSSDQKSATSQRYVAKMRIAV